MAKSPIRQVALQVEELIGAMSERSRATLQASGVDSLRKLTDCELRCGDGVSFPCHRAILAQHSNVFRFVMSNHIVYIDLKAFAAWKGHVHSSRSNVAPHL